MILIDGKIVSAKVREEIKNEVSTLKSKGVTPGLAVIIVGDDPASKAYVGMKGKACSKNGIYSETIKLPESIEEEALLKQIDILNKDDRIHGILVQLPLPKGMNESKILNSIAPKKDVDGFHPINVGKLSIGEDCFIPCTPFGIIKLIEHYGIETEGKNCVVIGRSNIVGKPIANLMIGKNATVTVCHSRTKNLKEVTSQGDIIIAAIGKPYFLTADMVKEGAVVIDVGINRTDSGLVGDVDFDNVKDKCSFITPVPGGVGPMTITMLLNNTLKSAKNTLK